VENYTSDREVPHLASSSTIEEWAIMGRRLFDAERYPQAMHSFERAGMRREADVASAYSLRKRAFGLPSGTRKEGDALAKAAFLAAAEAFIRCFQVAVTNDEKRDYLLLAAECYVNNGDILKAAHAYLDAKEYALAAQYYRKAGAFDDALRVVRDYKEDLDPKLIKKITDVICFVYIRDPKTVR
jgi:hypothetical protein